MRIHPLAILLGVAWLGSRGKHAARPIAEQHKAPVVYAYLYQLPEDAFSTTRMAFGEAGKQPSEMGLFGSPDAAKKVAKQKGWVLAWDGVRQLKTRPG